MHKILPEARGEILFTTIGMDSAIGTCMIIGILILMSMLMIKVIKMLKLYVKK